MKKRNNSRYVSLALLAVLLLGLLTLTGCTAAGSTVPMVWADAKTGEVLEDQNVTVETLENGKIVAKDTEQELVQKVDVSQYSEEVKMGVFDYVKLPFSYLLRWLYDFTGNYGIALILFSVIVKLIIFPTSAMSKKSMMKMSRLTPRVKALEEKFGDDKQGYQQAVSQLYREEGAGGCGGCLWALLPMLLLIPLYYIIREPITWLMFHGNVNPRTVSEIQNVFVAAKNAAAEGTALNSLNVTGFYWQMECLPHIDAVKAELNAISPEIISMNTKLLGVELATVPNLMFWKYFDIHGVWNSVGQFLLPLFSGGINMLSMFVSQKLNNKVIVNEKGEQDAEMAKKSGQNNLAMTLMMPLFSVYIGFIAPAGLSLYWFLQGVLGMIQDIFLTKHYKKVYDAEDAVKQQRAAELAAQEAERERIRAQRRAENPDGMIGNASKKKLQQREKNEQAAKEAAYLAAKASQEEREAEIQAQLARQEGERPFRRGRNYDPNRYKNDKDKE